MRAGRPRVAASRGRLPLVVQFGRSCVTGWVRMWTRPNIRCRYRDSAGPGGPLAAYRDDQLDLHRLVHGKVGRADGGAGMPATLAEDLRHQVREAVDDGGLVVEVVGAVDERQCLDDALDAVEVAQVVADAAQQLHAGGTGGVVRLFQGDLRADPALVEQVAVVVGRPVAGDEQQVAVLDARHEACATLHLGRQLDTGGSQPVVDVAHYGFSFFLELSRSW